MTLLRKLGTQAGLFVLWLVHFLPLPWIGALGAGLGSVLYRFGRGRVTRINLALCFPEMPEAERYELGLRHFKLLGRNAWRFITLATRHVNPDGTVLKWQPYGKEGLLIADIDTDKATGLLASRLSVMEPSAPRKPPPTSS